MNPSKTVFHWSGGKDSSIALQRILNSNQAKVGTLLTTVNRKHNRVTMHGVRRELIERQAGSLGLPLTTLDLPEQPDMQEYDRLMQQKMQSLVRDGYTHAAFGDIFLVDLKEYREKQMKKSGFEPLFPIWQEDTEKLIRRFIDDGFKGVVVSAMSEKLDKTFAGRLIDHSFLEDLPEDIDPCGENGEFHTFVFDGPIFSKPVPFKTGEIIYCEYNAPKTDGSLDGHASKSEPEMMGFWFCDLLPG